MYQTKIENRSIKAPQSLSFQLMAYNQFIFVKTVQPVSYQQRYNDSHGSLTGRTLSVPFGSDQHIQDMMMLTLDGPFRLITPDALVVIDRISKELSLFFTTFGYNDMVFRMTDDQLRLIGRVIQTFCLSDPNFAMNLPVALIEMVLVKRFMTLESSELIQIVQQRDPAMLCSDINRLTGRMDPEHRRVSQMIATGVDWLPRSKY